jgi:hypothetical protein
MTREQARIWKERWRIVNEAEIEELRKRTPEEDMRGLAAMMAAARCFPEDPRREVEEEAVRARWERLKRREH